VAGPIGQIDFSRLSTALDTPLGWVDLGLVAVCVAIAWMIDRGFERERAARAETLRVLGGIVRVAFPVIALILTAVSALVYREFAGRPLFLAIAIALLIALAFIRTLVYGLRRLFPSQQWLPTSEFAISLVIWVLVALYFLGVLPEIAAALDAVEIPIGKSKTTVLLIFQAIAVVVLTLVVTLWISGLIEQRISSATAVDVNLRAVLSRFIRAILLVIGVMIALQWIGFDLTLLTVFGGALGVGIGLGLQKLASSYIAGFTILLDRSIRLGDVITVDNRTGVVTEVAGRYCVLRSFDGIEAIIPNETLVTTTVLNHSFTTREVRVAVQVTIGYDNDVDLALKLLEEIARTEPRVDLKVLPPMAFLAGFGDSGMNLELGVWINDPENGQLNLRSALNRKILARFGENGIRISYPQRDVRVLPAEPGTPKPTIPPSVGASG